MFEQCLLLLFIADPCQRINAHGLEVIPDDLLAKRVNRRYFRGFHVIQGLGHMFGISLRLLSDALIQPLPHFSRGGPCEGDDQHTVQPEAFAHQTHDALHQHGRFARASRRADQDRMIPGINSGLLLFRPGHIITSKMFHVKPGALPLDPAKGALPLWIPHLRAIGP